MRSQTIFLTVVAALYTGVFLTCTAAYAQQSYEERAKTIMQLFESGQKDTAYAMLEPLKKSARFVPAVLFARAQMTPDDRALGLYKEVMALDPEGPWADKAAYQLVVRYAEKRDSLGAHVWAGALSTQHPRSPLVPAATDLLKGITSWRSADEELADIAVPASARPEPSEKKPAEKPAAKKEEAKKEEMKKAGEKVIETKKTAEKNTGAKAGEVASKSNTALTETYKSSGMKGYAIQVGIFSTRDLADSRSSELKKKSIRSVALPKMVDGKKYYALVVGPYTTIEDANKKKSVVAGACACDAFVVRVQ